MARRGEIYVGTFSDREQTVLVVSADGRNAAWRTVLVCPVLTTSSRYDVLDTTVALRDAEPVTGTVLCDMVFVASTADLEGGRLLGAVSAGALAQVGAALVSVFDIDWPGVALG